VLEQDLGAGECPVWLADELEVILVDVIIVGISVAVAVHWFIFAWSVLVWVCLGEHRMVAFQITIMQSDLVKLVKTNS
jgi:hypothetical protein